ncbi:MAG: PIN domain-containing protein [Opitutales bacterium]
MSILFDTNVILDIALARKPFAIESLEAFEKAQKADAPLIAPHSLATIYYLLASAMDAKTAFAWTEDLIEISEIARFDHEGALQALQCTSNDFEDGMVIAAAVMSGAESIVTRNGHDFTICPLPIYTPAEFLHG